MPTILTDIHKMRVDIIGNQLGLPSRVIRSIVILGRLWSNSISQPLEMQKACYCRVSPAIIVKTIFYEFQDFNLWKHPFVSVGRRSCCNLHYCLCSLVSGIGVRPSPCLTMKIHPEHWRSKKEGEKGNGGSPEWVQSCSPEWKCIVFLDTAAWRTPEHIEIWQNHHAYALGSGETQKHFFWRGNPSVYKKLACVIKD